MKRILILASVIAYASARVAYAPYGGYRPQNVLANQGSNAIGGAGSTVVATGTANAEAERVKREPQYYYARPQYLIDPGFSAGYYGGNRAQNVVANQESNAIGGAGSTVVASGTSTAGAERVKREPQYYPYPPYGGYGGYRPQNVAATQTSNAVGGAGSNVVAAGTANASGFRAKREPQYYYQPSYPYQPYGGYGGYRPQNVAATQTSNAVGGAGSNVVAAGTATASGIRA